jgi:hypothetical protein
VGQRLAQAVSKGAILVFSEYHNRWKTKLVMMTPLITAFDQMRSLLKTIDIDVEMVCGWRGEKDQAKALAAKASKAAFGDSPHNFGAAFDLVPVVDGKLNYDVPAWIWYKIGMAGEKFGLTWGNDWDGDTIINAEDITPGSKYVDCPHFQIKNWREKGFKLYHEEPPIG